MISQEIYQILVYIEICGILPITSWTPVFFKNTSRHVLIFISFLNEIYFVVESVSTRIRLASYIQVSLHLSYRPYVLYHSINAIFWMHCRFTSSNLSLTHINDWWMNFKLTNHHKRWLKGKTYHVREAKKTFSSSLFFYAFAFYYGLSEKRMSSNLYIFSVILLVVYLCWILLCILISTILFFPMLVKWFSFSPSLRSSSYYFLYPRSFSYFLISLFIYQWVW